jgi:predicted DCC family thiol-disulfide oxidoreductase YuxK
MTRGCSRAPPANQARTQHHEEREGRGAAFDAPARLPFTAAVSAARHLVLYDGECSLCTFQMKLLTWLDWCDAVRLLPIADPEAARVAPTLTREALLEAIHCVTPDGAIHRGARCLRFVGLRMPLLIPLALVLWIPGVIWVAERIYMWVSRNRHLLSRLFGCKDACAILPARKRGGDA